jgi:hypothetical protein
MVWRKKGNGGSRDEVKLLSVRNQVKAVVLRAGCGVLKVFPVPL